jgi:hypothetical protein
VQFNDLTITLKTVKDYENGNSGKEIYTGSLENFDGEQAKQEVKRIVKEEEEV